MYQILVIGIITLISGSATDNSLDQFLQPDNIDSGEYDDLSRSPPHLCTRTCRAGDSKTCYYKFTVLPWTTMDETCGNCTTSSKSDCFKEFCVTADGVERSILAINRKMPGPSIQVCKGDNVVVDVVNIMPGRSTAIHWHGLRQRNSPYMDGVPMVTQCPIPEATTFRYVFIADDPGTQFYHSHDGLQKIDGVVGSLVVRVPRSEDPNSHLYDVDLPSHTIVIQDWHHVMADELFPGLRNRGLNQMPETYLIQGRGIYHYPNGTKVANTPIAEFSVTRGLRYMFRIIAATCYQCQYIFTMENHDMVIIEADGTPTEPYTVDSLTMSPGERFSVVVNCNRSIDAYWIQVRTVGYCATKQAYQAGILRYKGHREHPSSMEPGFNDSSINYPGITANPFNSNCTEKERKDKGPCAQDLRSASTAPDRITAAEPDYTILWQFDFFVYPNQISSTNKIHYGKHIRAPKNHVATTVNGIAFEFPPSPLLSQFDDIPSSVICKDDGFTNHTYNEYRQCVNIFSVPTNSVVEIIMIDAVMLKMSHPIHLHGYGMYVIEQGLLLEKPNEKLNNKTLNNFMYYINSGKRRKIPKNPVIKDTIPLMAGGYTIVRILTDNPGFWIFHCHFAFHLEAGMAGVLQVGNHSDFPPTPKNFPTCGNYFPPGPPQGRGDQSGVSAM